VRFKDPFNDLRGVADMRKALAMAFEHGTPRFEVIDRALQLHGGRGVRVGEVVERLYRDVRALRIYEGATEVQRLLVGRETLKAHRPR
jgi:alkylation response protein AidB-like acyl-CoA dehydrogenase